MTPTRTIFDSDSPVNIHVVMEPDGSVAIKRIAVKQSADDTQLIFYSDNATMHPPLCFSLNMDYEGRLRGRAWTSRLGME